jgi:7-cyano-7-deazaguanine synthase
MKSFAIAPQKKMLVVLSGGLDSATALGLAAKNAEKIATLTFNYGQRHVREIDSAKTLQDYYGVIEHYFFDTPDLGIIHRPFQYEGGPEPLLPKTWKPGRNMIFLAYATSLAYSIGATATVTGVHADDTPGYPDCRPLFMNFMENAAQQALATPMVIWNPLLYLNKTEIVKLGLQFGVPYQFTWTCYIGGEKPCHKCDACVRRERAFGENGCIDPLNDPLLDLP